MSRYGGYAYEVLDPKELENIEQKEGVELAGVYTPEGTDTKLIYSRVRTGSIDQPVTLNVVTRKERNGDRHFINVVDTKLDPMLNIGAEIENVALVSPRLADAMAGAAVQGIAGMRVVAAPAPTRPTREVAAPAVPAEEEKAEIKAETEEEIPQ